MTTRTRPLLAALMLTGVGALLLTGVPFPIDPAIGQEDGLENGQEDGQVPTLVQLRDFCQKLVRSEEVKTYPFHFSVEGGVVTFDAGDVQACSQSGALCSTPMGVLIRAQCRVELLRMYVDSEVAAGRPKTRDSWASTISESEQAIAKGLDSLRGRKHTNGVLLRRAVMTLWRVEEVFLATLWAWADQTGLILQTLKEAGGTVGEPCPPPPLPAVKLKITPPEGTLRYVAAIDWDMAELQGQDPQRVMTAVAGGEVPVAVGVYVVMAQWPDGTTLPPKRLRLTADRLLEKPAR